jgi:hypothetical protein
MKPRSIIIILTISLCGCFTYLDKELFKFSKSDFLHIQMYKPGDTLFFENSHNEVDSFLILDYETEERGQKQGFISTKPESDYWVCVTQLDTDKLNGFGRQKTIDGKITNYQWLVSLVKYPPSQTVHYHFSFMTFYTQHDSVFGIFHSDTIVLNKKAITNYYSISHSYPDRLNDPKDIEELLWTDKDGLVAYKFKNGLWWTKKSSR